MFQAEGFNPLWIPISFYVVAIAGESATLRRLLSARWLTSVGIASYSMYLVHQPFIDVLQRAGAAPIVAALCAVAAGFAFWAIVERPFVYTTLKARAVTAVHRFLSHYTERLHITNVTLVLRREPERTEELEAIA
jgi:peptidoglycan/LPS O-acetylase OafA/YrhL